MEDQAMAQGGATTRKRRTVRRFTTEQRRSAVAESLAPGASVRAVAKRHGIRPNLLSYWRKQQGVVGGARFAGVRVGEAPQTRVARHGVIEIDLAKGCVRVQGIVDAAMLREVLALAR